MRPQVGGSRYRTRARALLVVVLLAAAAGILVYRWPVLLPWPWPSPAVQRSAPPPAEAPPRVAAGVRLWGQDLGGWDRARLRAWLMAETPQLAREPVPARLDPVTRGVIPELEGVELDVDATVDAALAAPPGGEVRPQWRWLPPTATMADFPLAPLYRGNPAKQAVTFLVNVAWGNEELEAMLELLDREQVRASFFLVGRWVDAYPDLARAIAEHGHEIANHGYSDAVAIGRLGYEAARRDLEKAHAAIVAATGRVPRFFSPHRGELSPTLLEVARDLNYRLVMWTVDTIDWQDPPPQKLLDRVLSKVEPGSLILMHPRAVTVASLPALVDALRARGLPPVTLSELLDPRVPPRP
ncbi:MAG TPA: polysaccharide deacetylase family protein [Bacillota bacterium]